MIKRLLPLIFVCLIILGACSNKPTAPEATKNGKPLIVVYGDYKCPYCKKLEENVMPKLRENYLDNHKAEYQYINLAFLGKDAIIGSRASHAVEQYAPQQFLDFQQHLYAKQQDEKKEWLTESLLDKEIKKLNINQATQDKIIKDYKTKNSKSWKAADKDKAIAKEHHIKTTPTVFINGKKVEDPYKYANYDKLLKKYQ